MHRIWVETAKASELSRLQKDLIIPRVGDDEPIYYIVRDGVFALGPFTERKQTDEMLKKLRIIWGARAS